VLTGAGIVLAVAALAAGATGTWSPCGFSMVETIGRADRRRAVTLLACATFTTGALAGGVVTFGSLALAGGLLHGAGGTVATAIAAAIALAAAAGEARGARIVPQIRRQVPEPWRRHMPLPVAAALYGGLLGLGFTTFVLTWGVWALAAIALTLGEPELGVVMGVAFGLGRAAPVVALAPAAHTRWGIRATELMAERPSILRGLRLADALALASCALVLGTADASAATSLVTANGHDPAPGPGVLAWDGPDEGVLRAAGHDFPLPGRHPAIGGGLIAYVHDGSIGVVRLSDLQLVADVPAPGADAVAVSSKWLVYRTRSGTRPADRIVARTITGPYKQVHVASAAAPAQLGRPSIDRVTLVYSVEGQRRSRIVERRLGAHPRRRVLRSSRSEQLLAPSIRGGRLLYVRATSLHQQLVLGGLHDRRGDRILYRTGPAARRDPGHQHGYSDVTRTPTPRRAHSILWSTALTTVRAYLTLLPLPGHPGTPRIVSIGR
jgi:hypothetical protein